MGDIDEHDQVAQRRAKLAALKQGGNAYPNNFRQEHLAASLHERYGVKDGDELDAHPVTVKVAGRMMTRRVMGKASFLHLQDTSSRIQLYVRRDALPEGLYGEFKKWDLGDILGAAGVLFKTRTGELSIRVDELRLLTKALRPLPEKFHGLSDQETRYRQRYLDLISNEESRRVFRKRSAIINRIRHFLAARDFLEVETPMMQVIPGGASARPFVTYHNALDMKLYLRIAPELYLKRLVVGGFERVFEINRSFRNEGLSTEHNPEFTMLEFYQAYADFDDLMVLTEELMRDLAGNLSDGMTIDYQGKLYDLEKPFARMTVKEAILKSNPNIDSSALDDLDSARRIARSRDIPLEGTEGLGKVLTEIFEKTAESQLTEPTFITAFPTEVSPLSRPSDYDPSVVDRFELFIGGLEIANGFSELNDPEEQAERFRAQAANREAGDEEAMYYDQDYIRALEYGLPPSAGEGIGIDRLVMLFTNSASIRDVLLFPHMRPRD